MPMGTNTGISEPLPAVSNLTFIEGLYEDYLRDPASVPPDWQQYFAEFGDGELRFPKPRLGPSFRPFSIFNPPSRAEGHGSALAGEPPQSAALQDRVYLLIRLYRVRGHRIAQVDPLGLPQPVPPELQPEFFGFNYADLALPVS